MQLKFQTPDEIMEYFHRLQNINWELKKVNETLSFTLGVMEKEFQAVATNFQEQAANIASRIDKIIATFPKLLQLMQESKDLFEAGLQYQVHAKELQKGVYSLKNTANAQYSPELLAQGFEILRDARNAVYGD